MIFISVGTEVYPFNRLLKVIDDAVAEKRISYPVFAQTGNSDYKPKHYQWKNFLTFTEVEKNIRESNVCVLHAGVGSTLLSLSLGVVPIIFPRKFDLGEHLDDHQIEFSNKFNEMKKCLVAYDENELIHMINHYDEIVKEVNKNHQKIDKESGLVQYLNIHYPLEGK